MANPIKTTDIYQDTGDLQKLIAELEQVQVAFESLRKTAVSDAVKLEKNVKAVTGATVDQREELEKNAKAADEISRRYQKFNDSLEENAVKIAALKNAQQQMNRINKLTAKQLASVEGSYDNLSAQYSLMKIRINQMGEATKEAREEKRAMEKEAAKLYERMKQLQEATGKHTLNVGNYRSALEGLNGPIGNTISGLKDMGGQFKALIRSPLAIVLGTIIGAVVTLGKAFFRSEKGAEVMTKATGVLNGVMSGLTEVAAKLGEGLIKAFTDPIGSLKELGRAVGRGFKAFFTDPIGSVRDLTSAIKSEVAEVMDDIDAFTQLEVRKKAVIATNRELAKSVEDLTTQEELYRVVADDTTKSFEEREVAAENARQALEARAAKEIEIARGNLSLINEELALRRSNGEAVSSLLDQQLEAYRALAQAEREYTVAVADNERTRAELKQDRLERDLDILIDGFDNQKTINERLIADDKKTLVERSAILSETLQLAEDTFAKQIETIQQFTGVAVDANELLATSDAVTLNQRIRALGLSEVIEGRLLEIIRERRLAVQDLTEVEAELTELRRAQSQIDAVPLLGAFQQQAEQAKATAEDAIKTARRLTVAPQEQQQAQNIYDLLGFNLDDGQQQAINDATAFAIGQIQQLSQAKTEAANRAVQDSDREVEAARANLQATIALAAEGYAVNVQQAQQELALAQQEQERALRLQRKAQREQQVIETIQQGSSLVTAAAKIWAQLGFPAALPAVGLMFGSFAAAKIRAAKLTREFGEGDYQVLQGPRHNGPGTGIPLGVAADGVAEYAEGGEGRAIFSRRAVARYGSQIADVVRQFNTLTFGDGAMDLGRRALQAVVVGSGVNTGKMEGYLHEISQNSRAQTYTDGRGRRVVKRGNITTVYY